VVLIGIAGGVAAKGVSLGDILVADQIVDYELQKLTPKGPDIRWEVHRADPRLVGSALNFTDETWQESITAERPDDGSPRRHMGPIASGDKVIAFGAALAKYRETWSKLIGVEMEAGGVAAAAFQAAERPGFFMVRGVSDLADEQKSSPEVEKWRQYACDVAASYAIALLRSGPILPISSAQPSETVVDLHSIETKLDQLPATIREDLRGDVELERSARTHAVGDRDVEPVLVLKELAPYLRTIEHQEKDLSQYKTALEGRIKQDIDQAVELMRNHQLKEAQALLETARDKTFPSVPNLDEIDPSLREGLFRLLGLCHLRLGEPDAALANFEIAKSIEGKTEKLRKALLEWHIVKGNFDTVSQMAHEMLSENPSSMEAKNALAIVQLNEEDFAGVVESYEGESQADNDSSSQSILSFAYLKLGNLPSALETAQRFAELEPQLPQAYETLGNTYLAIAYAPAQRQTELQTEWFQEILDRDSLHKAIKNYQKALERNADLEQYSSSEAVRMNLANALSSDGRLTEALELIEENLKNIPEPHIENFILKAQFNDGVGEIDRAIETCLQALSLYPNDQRLTGIMGGLYLNKEDPERAREWLDKAEENCADPKELAFLKIIRSKTHLIQNDREGSWGACLQDIPATEQDKTRTLLALGDHFFHFKNFTQAEHYYQQALARESENLGLLDRIVRFYRNFRKPEQALEYAERFMGLVETPTAYANYLELLIESGRPQEALFVLEKVKQKGFDLPVFSRQEAFCRQRLGQFSQAVTLYEEYLEYDPDDFAVTFNLGICYQKQGQREKAIQALISAEKLQPTEVQVHVALAQMYLIEGQRERAYEHASRVLDLASNDPDVYLFFFQIAHFSGYEEEAARTLSEVPGRFPEYEHLKVIDLEEAKEVIASSREHYNQIKGFYHSGNLPLVLVAKWLCKPLPLIWRVFSHDRDVRILSALGNLEGQRNSHAAASQSAQVVIDYSALLTLYHLELLDLPTRLFEKVYIAQSIFDQIQQDITHLTLSIQLDRLERLERIRDTVLQHPKLHRLEEWLEGSLMLDAQQTEDIIPFTEQDVLLTKQHSALYLLDNPLIFTSVEQVLPNQVTTTKRILDFLKQNGKLRATDYDKACNHLRKTDQLYHSNIEDIGRFQVVVVSYLSLQILVEAELFDLIAAEFDAIYVGQPTLHLLRQGIGEIRFYQHLLKTVREIESAVRSNDGYHVQPATLLGNTTLYPEDESINGEFLGTLALAEELQLPIWTDDLASRKLAAGNERESIATFDTRTVLDVAASKKQVKGDKVGNSILALLKWGYYFIPINSLIIYWSVEQHNFHLNEDTDLLLSSLGESVTNVYRQWNSLVKQSVERQIDFDQLEHQTNLFLHNMRIYADFLLHLWHNIPAENAEIRFKWTQFVFSRAFEAIDEYYPPAFFLVATCIWKMLQSIGDERLDRFLVFCANPSKSPPPKLLDNAILFVLNQLYNEGSYDDYNLQLASRLLNNLRRGQFDRVLCGFGKDMATSDFFHIALGYDDPSSTHQNAKKE